MPERMAPSDLATQVQVVARKAHEHRRSLRDKSQEERDNDQSPGPITAAVHMLAAHVRNFGTIDEVHTYCKGLMAQNFDPQEPQNDAGNQQSRAAPTRPAQGEAGKAA